MKVKAKEKAKTGTFILMAFFIANQTEKTEGYSIVLDKRIPDISRNYTYVVKELCDCRWVCFALPNCTHSSVERHNDTAFQCFVSYAPIDYDLLEPASSAIIFMKMPYYAIQLNGMYYRLYSSGSSWNKAKNKCHEEGGQLSIVNTDVTLQDVSGLLAGEGIAEAWIGLYTEEYKIKDLINPMWQYRSGAVSDPSIPKTPGTRCFTAKKTNGLWTFANSNMCRENIPFVCQRNY